MKCYQQGFKTKNENLKLLHIIKYLKNAIKFSVKYFNKLIVIY
jgi:hypothetical protein